VAIAGECSKAIASDCGNCWRVVEMRPQPYYWQIGVRRQLLASAARQLLASAARQLLASGGNVASAMLLADRCEAAIAGECGKAIAGECGNCWRVAEMWPQPCCWQIGERRQLLASTVKRHY